MTKLLICDDNTLKKRGTISANIRLIKKFIEDGNRFLLTTSESKSELLGNDEDFITYIHEMNPLKMNSIQYTDLSCLNGLYLYDSEGNPTHCYGLDDKLIQKFDEIPRKKSCLVDISKSYADFDNANDNTIGSLKIYISSDNKEKYLKTKIHVDKIIKESQDDIMYTVSYDHDKFHSASYYIRPIDATEKNQIKYIMKEHDINKGYVLDLRGEDPDILLLKISDFSKRRIKR